MNIRNSIKGIILRDKKVLFTKNLNEMGEEYYILPGGGHNHGENMIEALQRECMEEISCRVEVENLVFIRDYIGKNHEFSLGEEKVHQIEYMFTCTLSEGETPRHGSHPDDPGQIGIEWLPMDKLEEYPIYPKVLKRCLSHRDEYGVYLGDIN